MPGTLSAARERITSYLEPHSVWLHNSLRGAAGLGLAVLVARLTGVQHSFWVVLGALSVLRSNALNTGQDAVRAMAGTVAGFIVGAALLAGIGTNTTLLWFLLPLAVFLAGVAPAVISFAGGQAAFTLTVVILFNILQPTGWRVGLVRIEDVALGVGVSLVVGVLFWPRGAAPALRQALAQAYADGAGYLASSVRFGVSCGDPRTPAPPALARHGFSCWIFSGGGTDFMRAWTADAYGLPPYRVIGSVGETEFRVGDSGPELVKSAKVGVFDDGPQKPSSIHRHVGQRPILAAGNTDGDLAMLQWTAASPHRTLELVVRHTDGEREYAYDRDPILGSGTGQILSAVAEHTWTVIDMAADWSAVHPSAPHS